MRVKEVMSTALETIAPDARAAFANELMWRKQIHHLVVMDGDMMVGLLSDTDLGGPGGKEIPDNLAVRDVMRRRVRAIDPEDNLKHAANIMRENHFHCLPVMDRHGKLLGILTSTDLDRLATRGVNHPPYSGQEPVPPRVKNFRPPN